MAAIILVSLALMGRVWWCQAGDLWPWSWNVWSQHNSQHLVDPYSLSHLQHGIGLYLVLTALAGRHLTRPSRALCVATVEAVWELVENTNWMIERYRATTMSLGYAGDSILNSLGDYGTCLIGVWLAQRLPGRRRRWLVCGPRIDQPLVDPRQSVAQHPDADLSPGSDPLLANGIRVGPALPARDEAAPRMWHRMSGGA